MAGNFNVVFRTQAIITDAQRRGQAAQLAALEVIKRTTDPLTPRKTGNLINSCEVTIQGNGGWIRYTAPYAAIQHERMDYRHTFGGPKYLERGIRLATSAALAAMKREL